MSQQRLTEARVHELIATYAKNNSGATPSATRILELNGQFGSLQSATRYRKSYLEKQPTATPDPFAGFPSAIAEAAKEMQSTLKEEAQREIEAIKIAAEEEVKALEQQLESVQNHLIEKSEIESDLRSQLLEISRERDSLIDETRSIRTQLDSTSSAHANTQKVLAVEKERSTQLTQQVETLSDIETRLKSSFTTQDKLLTDLYAASQTLKGKTEVLSDNQHAGNRALTVQIERIIDSLNDDRQSLARLVKTNNEVASNAAKHAEQYQGEIAKLRETIERQQQQLEVQQQESMHLMQNETAEKIDTRIDLIQHMTEQILKVHELLPANRTRTKDGHKNDSVD
ncbi:MAG: hypothetical protein CL693_01130 [Cellvibrionaceae bacterium]|nr:hypothetical protein [Cellvibrionaceae bacterium]|tara:strand:+ start:1822 stop:2847 length:1026 start_codon:yes stop_codon:yes gene_type:complete